MKKFKRKDCPWVIIGKDATGDILWCEDCGSIVSSDNSNLQQPSHVDNTFLCYDRGMVP